MNLTFDVGGDSLIAIIHTKHVIDDYCYKTFTSINSYQQKKIKEKHGPNYQSGLSAITKYVIVIRNYISV